MSEWINFNGKILPGREPIAGASNRGLRYGDGLFETIRMEKGEMPLYDLHMQRLFRGLALLGFELPALFSSEHLKEEILRLVKKNKVEKAARVRINVFRGNGGLFDPEDLRPNYVIEADLLAENYFRINENGLTVDVYSKAIKSCDSFSNIKSNNYLSYAMAALWAKQEKLNDALLMNQYGRICDSSIANVFWLKDGIVYTPPLSEGPVAGVMRRFILESIKEFPVKESVLTTEMLEEAEEIFLSNAAYGIRWIKQFRNTQYTCSVSKEIYKQLFRTIGGR